MSRTNISGRLQVHDVDPATGFGIGVRNNKKVYVPYTLPGEQVTIERVRKKKKRIVADEFSIDTYSDRRVEPACEHFGTCGGDVLEHMPYADQLALKERRLQELLADEVPVHASPASYGYRNRLDVAVTDTGIGFKVPGKWWQTVDIAGCQMMGAFSYEALTQVRAMLGGCDLAPWNMRERTGFVRYAVLREAKYTGERLVNLITADGDLPPVAAEYFDADSVYWSINDGAADISVGEPQRHWGNQYLHETLCGITFAYGPNTFFQVNPYQAQQLMEHVRSLVHGPRVLDLYCGVGIFSLDLARSGLQVEGVELDSKAIELARLNASQNGIGATFSAGEDRHVADFSAYDTVVIDPPRSGLHPKVLKRLTRDKPREIVYVSCNPTTLAEALATLSDVYDISNIQGFDMFPQTPHVEAVARLERRAS
jgi:23S rRNA (uracil-5-)-methyltransferase RumA